MPLSPGRLGSPEANVGQSRPPWGGRARRWLPAVAWTAAVVALYFISLRLSQTVSFDSDGATDSLEALDILHGNVLLHGWLIGDVSFYTTELPEYVLVIAIHGFSAGLGHVSAAITYTLEVLLAALLAMGRKGTVTGRQRLARAAIAVLIMLAPQFPAGINLELGVPDHAGTSVSLLLALVLVDRLPARWYLPVATSVILFLGQWADVTVFYVGALPFMLVCGYRALRSHEARRSELALAAGALVAGIAGAVAPHLMAAIGGYQELPANTNLASLGMLGGNARWTGLGLLVLFGADFVGITRSAQFWFAIVHLAGLILAGCALLAAAWRLPRRDTDRTVQLLVVGIVINSGAYLMGTRAFELLNAREMAAVLPFAAVLAGRVLAARLLAIRLAVPVLAIVLAGYLGGLAWGLRQPVAPGQLQSAVALLKEHHLHYGLSGYWDSNALTLTAGNQVQARPVVVEKADGLEVYWEQRQAQWYDPKLHYANFVLFNTGQIRPGPFSGFTAIRSFTLENAAIKRFGKPTRIYHDGPYTVFVWNKNLLTELPPLLAIAAATS
jgi:hypothetical protein